MPVLCIMASVLLQSGVYGFVSGRLGSTDSLALSCAGFGAAAVVFNAVLLVRRRRAGRGGAPVAPPPGAGRLLLAMNVVTAVTFLSFYAALSWIPSALATGIETAIGPAVLALLGLAGIGRRATAPGWAAAGLLVVLGGAIAWSFTGDGGMRSAGAAAGIGLVLVAGIGASVLALVSAELGRRGIDPVHATAHRFHLTFLCGGALLLVVGGTSAVRSADWPALLVTGVLAVTVPLFLLQRGLQGADPMVAMVLLTTLPGVTYLAETAFHGGFDGLSFALICALMAVALWYARLSREEPSKGAGDGDGTEAGSRAESGRRSGRESARVPG